MINSGAVYIEIGQSSLRLLKGDAGLELPLERQENGRLSDLCRERVTAAVQSFLKRQAWQPKARALCAVNARGISLRQISLPMASGEELRRLLLLQIESEFPLSPDELAWGYRQIDAKERPGDGSAGRQTVLVAAAKKEALEQYAELLTACGVSPVFTLAALARGYLCSPLQSAYAMLEVSRQQTELTAFENGAAVSVRVLPWGGENFGQAEIPGQFLASVTAALGQRSRKLYLTGEGIRDRAVAERLATALSGIADCERIETAQGDGKSPAIFGLKKAAEKDGGESLLTIQVKEAKNAGRSLRPVVRTWAIRAGALFLAVLLFPYAEALVMKPRLARKISELEKERGRLTMIDRELAFLQYIKSNEPPYLEAVYLMANSAAQGTRIESISMDRRGEVSIKGVMPGSQQVLDFRSKLISSGFYSNVVVEEQTPMRQPGQPQVNVRMTAQWKSEPARELLALGPAPEEFEKLRTAAKDARFAPPMMPMMGGPFPGMGMPMMAPPMAAPPSQTKKPVVRSPTAASRRVVLPPGAGGPVIIPGPPDSE